MIAAVESGEQPYLDLHVLLREFPDTYPSLQEAKEQLQTYPEILIHGSTAISILWLTEFGTQCVDELKLVRYTALQPKIFETFPADCETFLTERMEKHVRDAFTAESEDIKLENVGYYLVVAGKLESDRDLLFSAAKENAALRWESLNDNPTKELKLQVDEIFAPILADQPIVHSLLKDKATRRSVEETFWTEIARLETDNEADFSDFWAKRIMCRIRNWEHGLAAFGEGKLQDQLAEVLFEHLKNENLPVSITKAQDQKLLRSRKTQKNIQKLQNSLAASGSLTDVLASLAKFNKKQGVPELDETALAAAKEVMLSDMNRWMQRRNDGPTLFLTLVAFLLAKCVDGVVYATGKFSPKLLKLIKPDVSVEQYAQLETWKGMIKGDSLTDEDKAEMKRWVREHAEGTRASPEASLEVTEPQVGDGVAGT